MRVDFSFFEKAVSGNLGDLLTSSKDAMIDYIKTHDKHLSIKLIQAQIEFRPDEDQYLLNEEFVEVYSGESELKNKKSSYLSITDNERNYFDTYEHKSRVFNLLQKKYSIIHSLVKDVQVQLFKENIFRVEVSILKENIYQFNEDKLRELFIKSRLRNEIALTKKHWNDISERNVPGRKYDEMVSINFNELVTLRDKAKSKYLEFVDARNPDHKFFFSLFRELDTSAVLFQRYLDSPTSETRMKADNSIALDDFEIDENGFMYAIFNRLFKLIDETIIKVDFINPEAIKKHEIASIAAYDLKFTYGDFSTFHEYKQILQSLKEYFKKEVRQNIKRTEYLSQSAYYLKLITKTNSTLANYSMERYGLVMVADQPYPQIKKDFLVEGPTQIPRGNIAMWYELVGNYWQEEHTALNEIKEFLSVEVVKLREELSKQDGAEKINPISRFGDFRTNHQKQHGYDIDKLLAGFGADVPVKNKIKYLIAARTDYNDQNYTTHKKDFWGFTFPDHVNYWIRQFKRSAGELVPDQKPIPAIPKVENKVKEKPLPPIILNDNITVLVDMFIQLLTEVKNKKGEPIFQADNSRIARLICENFVDEKGNPVKYDQVLTRFSPSKVDKRPKGDSRIPVGEIYKAAQAKSAKQQKEV